MDIQSILNKILPGLGHELVDFELIAQGNLCIFISKEGDTTVEDCAVVSSYLSRVFMVEDIDYKRLGISSSGLDRPPKKAADFVHLAGQNAEIKARLSTDDQKSLIGRIESYENSIVTVSPNDKTTQIGLSDIDKACLRPKLKL